MFRDLRLAWKASLVTLYVALAWMVGLGVIAWWTVDAVRTFMRERLARAISIRCGRDHEVAQWGEWRCPCGTQYEGNCWTCPTCGEGGLIACDRCGLTIRNPRLV